MVGLAWTHSGSLVLCRHRASDSGGFAKSSALQTANEQAVDGTKYAGQWTEQESAGETFEGKEDAVNYAFNKLLRACRSIFLVLRY